MYALPHYSKLLSWLKPFTVLTRKRDVDMTVRRLVYGSVLLTHADLPDIKPQDLYSPGTDLFRVCSVFRYYTSVASNGPRMIE
jgi:hypothetical protein